MDSMNICINNEILRETLERGNYAFTSYGGLKHKRYIYLYGLTGLFIPASLSIMLTISEGGCIAMERSRPVLNYWALFTSPLAWSIVVLSLTTVLYNKI